jgi:hypothetical protein
MVRHALYTTNPHSEIYASPHLWEIHVRIAHYLHFFVLDSCNRRINFDLLLLYSNVVIYTADPTFLIFPHGIKLFFNEGKIINFK